MNTTSTNFTPQTAAEYLQKNSAEAKKRRQEISDNVILATGDKFKADAARLVLLKQKRDNLDKEIRNLEMKQANRKKYLEELAKAQTKK